MSLHIDRYPRCLVVLALSTYFQYQKSNFPLALAFDGDFSSQPLRLGE